MIDINLLPQSMRKKESMKLSQLLVAALLIAVLGVLVHFVTKYHFDIIPGLESRISLRERERAELRVKAEELRQINAEIDRLTVFVEAVKGLYKGRVVWSKVLSDVKAIVNFDASMSHYNAEMRYIWLNDFTGREKKITMNAFATASSQVVAMQMPEQLLQRIRSYVPAALPEQGEEERLQEELRRAVAEHENERRDRPELPIQGPRELSIRQRLEEIRTIQSGGLALLPFNDLLVPGSLQLRSASWTSAPQPKGDRGREMAEVYPKMAWSFAIEMDLK